MQYHAKLTVGDNAPEIQSLAQMVVFTGLAIDSDHMQAELLDKTTAVFDFADPATRDGFVDAALADGVKVEAYDDYSPF